MDRCFHRCKVRSIDLQDLEPFVYVLTSLVLPIFLVRSQSIKSLGPKITLRFIYLDVAATNAIVFVFNYSAMNIWAARLGHPSVFLYVFQFLLVNVFIGLIYKGWFSIFTKKQNSDEQAIWFFACLFFWFVMSLFLFYVHLALISDALVSL